MKNKRTMWKNYTAFIIICVLSITTGRAEDFKSGVYGCNATSAHTATVVFVDSCNGQLIIPETVECRGRILTVTAVDGDIISDKEKDLSVSLPSTLVKLGDSVFKGCIGLRSIDLPSSIQEIGSDCFSGCENLEALVLPDHLQTIRENAFRNCRKAFSDVVLGEMETIGANAFRGCTSLRSFEVSSLEDLGGYVFAECDQLESCKLPTSYGYLGGDGLFMGCTKLQEIIIPLFLVDYSFCEEMFAGCSLLSSVQLPPTMRYIGDRMFADCENLTSILIPQDITRIYNAFEGCSRLREIDMMAETPPYLSEEAFSDEQCENLVVYVPMGCKQVYEESDYWKKMKHIEEKESFNNMVIVSFSSYRGNLSLEGVPTTAIKDGSDPNLNIAITTITANQDYVLTVLPDPYYELDRLYLNDELVTEQVIDNKFAIHGATQTLRFQAYFKQLMAEIEVVQSELGRVKFQLPQGKPYTYSIKPDSGWVVHSVTYNDTDITDRVKNGEIIDTPILEEDAVVHIAFMAVEDGITVADKEQMRVLVYDKGVNISHALPNEIISVYTIDGRIVATKKSDYNGSAAFALEKGKVYLIKTKEKTIKFAI